MMVLLKYSRNLQTRLSLAIEQVDVGCTARGLVLLRTNQRRAERAEPQMDQTRVSVVGHRYHQPSRNQQGSCESVPWNSQVIVGLEQLLISIRWCFKPTPIWTVMTHMLSFRSQVQQTILIFLDAKASPSKWLWDLRSKCRHNMLAINSRNYLVTW